jgi:hypothetical protein
MIEVDFLIYFSYFFVFSLDLQQKEKELPLRERGFRPARGQTEQTVMNDGQQLHVSTQQPPSTCR